MFVLAVEDILGLRSVPPSSLFDGMPISVTVNGHKELYIWWEGEAAVDDGHLIVKLNTPNTNLGAFRKVFNRFVSSPSVPFGNPTPEQVGIYWLDSSSLTVYLASSFVFNEVRQYRWIQLVANAGSK
jgi:hypothetical protein